MAKTYKDQRAQGSPARRSPREASEPFRCGHCHRMIGEPPSGGRQRNHCPLCLYSRHVDATAPGDRASDCKGLMAPVGAFTRPKGEHVIVHRCLGCRFERYCRIAADDDFDLVLSLPEVEPRHDPRGG
jgi:hypothetical protein